jgi:hypothetical protein
LFARLVEADHPTLWVIFFRIQILFCATRISDSVISSSHLRRRPRKAWMRLTRRGDTRKFFIIPTLAARRGLIAN